MCMFSDNIVAARFEILLHFGTWINRTQFGPQACQIFRNISVYRLGHRETYVSSLLTIAFCRRKHPKGALFNFENKDNDCNAHSLST